MLKKKLLKAQHKMKTAADNHRMDVTYFVGDWVYVHIYPYRQSSVTDTRYHKLIGKRYYGPYKIMEVIGSVAYLLELPSTCRIHPVFHCSLLKPHHGPITSQQHICILENDMDETEAAKV